MRSESAEVPEPRSIASFAITIFDLRDETGCNTFSKPNASSAPSSTVPATQVFKKSRRFVSCFLLMIASSCHSGRQPLLLRNPLFDALSKIYQCPLCIRRILISHNPHQVRSFTEDYALAERARRIAERNRQSVSCRISVVNCLRRIRIAHPIDVRYSFDLVLKLVIRRRCTFETRFQILFRTTINVIGQICRRECSGFPCLFPASNLI